MSLVSLLIFFINFKHPCWLKVFFLFFFFFTKKQRDILNTSTTDMDSLSQGVLQEWRPHDWESISYPEQTNKNSKWSFWHLFINELMTRAETNRRELLSILWVSHCATALMNDNDAIITSFSESTRLDERHYGICLNTSEKKNVCVKNLLLFIYVLHNCI